MSAPVRIQLRRAKGWRMQADTERVDRSTKWGNPCLVGFHGTREECVYWFRLAMAGSIVMGLRPYPDGGSVADALMAYRKMAARNLHHLRGKNLACWCPLDAPCHADVLLELANQ